MTKHIESHTSYRTGVWWGTKCAIVARDFKTYANFLLDHGLHPGDIRFTYIQDIYDLQKISPDWHVLVFLEGWQETRRSGDAAILYESAARWLGKRTVNLDILLDPGVMRSD